MDIGEILDRAKLPEKPITLCLDGELVGRFEELEHQLRTASNQALSLGEPSQASRIAREMEELRTQMTAGEVTFRMRALPGAKPWRDLLSAQPEEGTTEEKKATFDERYHGWVCHLIASSCYEPAMTAEQADQLAQRLSGGQWKSLLDAAWAVNAERRNVPFSNLASVLTASSELNSKPQKPGASRTAGGSAKSRRKPPRTNTTKADG